MTQRFVDVPGGRLNVVDEGTGPAVVLVHAGIANLRAWDQLAPLLVLAGYRVVRYDVRGFGESTTEDVTFSNRADLIEVLDALGIGRAALAGNSRGGMVALDTALEYPDRVVAFVGVASGLGGFEGPETPDEAALFEEMDRLENLDPPDPDAVADIDVRVWVDGPSQPAGRAPAWIRDAVHAMDAPLYLPGHVMGEPIPLEPVANERLDELRLPILMVAGTLDVSKVAVMARYLEANAPNGRALIWNDVAHMIGMEQPERLATAMVEFLAPLPRWS